MVLIILLRLKYLNDKPNYYAFADPIFWKGIMINLKTITQNF